MLQKEKDLRKQIFEAPRSKLQGMRSLLDSTSKTMANDER
jgi:hypothetical protein